MNTLLLLPERGCLNIASARSCPLPLGAEMPPSRRGDPSPEDFARNRRSSVGDHPLYMYERAFFFSFSFIVFDPPPEFSDVTNPSHMACLAVAQPGPTFSVDNWRQFPCLAIVLALSLFLTTVFFNMQPPIPWSVIAMHKCSMLI